MPKKWRRRARFIVEPSTMPRSLRVKAWDPPRLPPPPLLLLLLPPPPPPPPREHNSSPPSSLSSRLIGWEAEPNELPAEEEEEEEKVWGEEEEEEEEEDDDDEEEEVAPLLPPTRVPERDAAGRRASIRSSTDDSTYRIVQVTSCSCPIRWHRLNAVGYIGRRGRERRKVVRQHKGHQTGIQIIHFTIHTCSTQVNCIVSNHSPHHTASCVASSVLPWASSPAT